ncbi:MAG: tyrosine-protein phosphatase [Halieaceae bacterium]|nr:tyrosine-protein phosphatase [Halieaceae bacterium]
MSRHIPLDGAPNFRDFGGHPVAQAGRRVKYGRLFRAGHLADLSHADLEVVNDLGISHLYDFRRSFEQEYKPNHPAVLVSIDHIIHLDITPGNQAGSLDVVTNAESLPSESHDFMCEINRELALSHQSSFRQVFEGLLADPEATILVHCAAGKDRTGFAAAVVLLALGVELQVVMQDYLLTQCYFLPHEQIPMLRDKYGFDGVSDQVLEPIVATRLEYLQAGIQAMIEHSGSIDQYLLDAFGLGESERQLLRERLTEAL